jgi:hypothetical protein
MSATPTSRKRLIFDAQVLKGFLISRRDAVCTASAGYKPEFPRTAVTLTALFPLAMLTYREKVSETAQDYAGPAHSCPQ